MYIDEVGDEDEAAHRDGTQTPDDDEYADMKTKERPEQDDVDSKTYDKYIGAEVMMDVPGEVPKHATMKKILKTRTDREPEPITVTR